MGEGLGPLSHLETSSLHLQCDRTSLIRNIEACNYGNGSHGDNLKRDTIGHLINKQSHVEYIIAITQYILLPTVTD